MAASIVSAPWPPPPSCRRSVSSSSGPPAYLADLERLVNIDCGSYTAGVNQVAGRGREQLERLGATVERAGGGVAPDGRPLGDLVVGRIPGSGPRLLLIGHMDTVFEPGTAAARPFRSKATAGWDRASRT